ncbi:MAG: tetratricopeptide repeat protein [Ignavibacteria bacterium]|nr:tetratricopeptide repeat protein [Ignavibacteria bacterium]
MAKIIEFPFSNQSKTGLKKVSSRIKEDTSQMNLFRESANIIELPEHLSPFEKALRLDDIGRPNDAKKEYINAIELNDNPADAYCNLGIIEYQNSNISSAIDCFTKALTHNPRHYESHYNLANLYSEVGNLQLAKVHYEFAKEIDSSDTDLHFNLALVYAMMKQFTPAIESMKIYSESVSGKERENAEVIIQGLKKLAGII